MATYGDIIELPGKLLECKRLMSQESIRKPKVELAPAIVTLFRENGSLPMSVAEKQRDELKQSF